MSYRLKAWLLAAVVAIAIVASLVIALRHLALTHWKIAKLLGRPVPVQLTQVGTGGVDESLASEGTAREFEIVPLSALETGRVAAINVRLGDKVRKKQRLADMDPVPLVSALKSAREQLQLTEEQLGIHTRKAQVMQELFDRKLVALDELNAALLNKVNTEKDVAQRRDTVVQASVKLAAAHIDSPVDGIVTQRDTYVGTIVKGQTPILTIAQTEPMLINAPYPEDKIRNIHIGQPATITMYAFPGQVFEGQVRWINPVIDPATRLMTVQVMHANSELKVQPGMRGIVRLQNQRTAVLRIPSIALLSTRQDFTFARSGRDDTAYVFVVKDNIAHSRKIRAGAYAEGYIEVKSGLQAGEQVVIVGQVGLEDNDRVRIHGASNSTK